MKVHAGMEQFSCSSQAVYLLILCTIVHITKHIYEYYNFLFVAAEAVQHLCHQPPRHVQRESGNVPTSHRHSPDRTSVQGIILERNAGGTL